MVGYYRRFIQDFAKIADPIFYLLKGENQFIWTEDCKEAFQKLKNCLITSPVLQYPNFNKPFVVHTDASLTAIGAVLSQEDEYGDEHPVAYYSRTLIPAEQNYTVTECECLAVIQAYKHF